jgi:hypothetical protein
MLNDANPILKDPRDSNTDGISIASFMLDL